MISVIIPFHNESATLGRCIDSLLAQTYTDWEAIMIDDGSTDGGTSICEAYRQKDGRIRLSRQPMRGVSDARNSGLSQAKGDLITFIDADDWVEPGFLQTFMDGYEGEQLCIQDMKMHDHGTTSTLGIEDKTSNDPAYISRATRLFGSCCNALFHTSIINSQNFMFDTRLSRSEDTDFIMRYALYINKVRTSSHAAYHYYMPDAKKTYGTPNLLYSSVKLYEDMLALTRNVEGNQRQKILEEEAEEDIDWAVEGLFYYPPDEKKESEELLAKFSEYFYPRLRSSRRKSYRHRLFKLACVSSNPRYIWLLSHAIMSLQRLTGRQ